MAIRNRIPESKPRTVSVYDGIIFRGFIVDRGRQGVEAFRHDGKSLGTFKNQKEAVAAIPARKAKEPAP